MLFHRFEKFPNEEFENDENDGIILPVTVILELGFPKSAVKLFVTVDTVNTPE